MTRPTNGLGAVDRLLINGVAGLLVAIGVLFVRDPRTAARLFGVPGDRHPLVFHYVTGLRTAWLGGAVLMLHRAGHDEVLGRLLLAMALNPAADLAVAASFGSPRRALVHAPGIVVTAALGRRLQRRERHG